MWELLEKELSREWYRVNFLDGKVSSLNDDVTVVVTTYNRAPYDPTTMKGKYNPLKLSLTSFLKQKHVNLKEIIVVNDCSTDYTEDVIKSLKNSEVEIVHLRNSERMGSSKSRNVGIDHASSRLIYFNDDDCIASPYAIYGGVYTFSRLKKRGNNVGAINLPVYFRATQPIKLKKIEEIGKIDFELGIKTENLDAFPMEYVFSEDKFWDEEKKILKPIQIQDLNGHFLASKQAIEEVGKFPEYFTWRNNYGEESELACRFTEKGYELFLSPDPKFHAVHIRYGYIGRKKLIGEDWDFDGMSIQDILKECQVDRYDTGNRVNAEEWYFSKILSLFILFQKRNPGGAKKYCDRTYKEFVIEGNSNTYYTIPDQEKRKVIFKSAIVRGILITSQITSG
jgi:glycosyltransferase involved in cell wall biosynthesis